MTKRAAVVLGIWFVAMVGLSGYAEHKWPTEIKSVSEDSSNWDCRTMGNHICGPGSGHLAGLYTDMNGTLCVWYEDGSGVCDGETIPALSEYDSDFCNDVDPKGTFIRLCRKD